MSQLKYSVLIKSLLLLIATLCSSSIFISKDNTEESEILESKLISDWNLLAYRIAYEHDQFYSLIGIRALTMVHLSIHDVLNSIHSHYERYAYFEDHPLADPVASVSQAAFEILVVQYPDRTDTLQNYLHNILDDLKQTEAKHEGLLLGKAVAKNMLQLRANDGHQKQGNYTPMSKPGDYQYTPGWNNWVLKPDFNYALPFALDTVTQFRSPPPPHLTTRQYTQSFMEVKKFGQKNSTSRSPDQTNYAHWWAEFAEHSWNRIGRMITKSEDMSPWEASRMFALINMDIYDIYLASLESKYYYDTWRPITAIINADTDNNPETTADKNWKPEMLTPPWPEYPSAHAAVGAGGAEIVSHILGTDQFNFSMTSTSAKPEAKTRSFKSFKEAAIECAESRIMNGYHFRFATDEGLRQGTNIARYIHSNFLKPK